MSCCLITDEEAQDWPMDSIGTFCEECGALTEWSCGRCGAVLCWLIACIKSHAANGCYNSHCDAKLTPVALDPHPTPDARAQHDPQDTIPEPSVDGQAVEAESLSERS